MWKPKGYNLLDGNLGDWYYSICRRIIDKNIPKSCIEHVVDYNYCPYCDNTTETIESLPELE